MAGAALRPLVQGTVGNFICMSVGHLSRSHCMRCWRLTSISLCRMVGDCGKPDLLYYRCLPILQRTAATIHGRSLAAYGGLAEQTSGCGVGARRRDSGWIDFLPRAYLSLLQSSRCALYQQSHFRSRQLSGADRARLYSRYAVLFRYRYTPIYFLVLILNIAQGAS